MNCADIIYDFLKEYGTLVNRQEGEEYALFSPNHNLGIEKKDIAFSKSGYLPKEDYLFLFPILPRPIARKEILRVGDRQFQVKEAETYCLGGMDIYQRVYAYEVRSVDE